MATPVNAVSTLAVKGMREDLENTIYRVAPEETPFTSALDSEVAAQPYHEWQTETIDAPNPGPVRYEGDDAVIEAGNYTSRLGNYAQHFERAYQVTGATQAAKLAGRANEMNRQKVLKGLALKRDIETRFLSNSASAAESAGVTPRATAGAVAFMKTNTSRGAGGVSGGFSNGIVAAATNGTARSFTEALLKSSLNQVFTATGSMTDRVAYMSPTIKQEAAAFTGLALNRVDNSTAKRMTILAGADVYQSDFGKVTFVPTIFGTGRDVLLVDQDMWAVGNFRPMATLDLAKTGDSDKQTIMCEKALICRNEAASAVIADVS